MQVIKRNGISVEWNRTHIANAVTKALIAVHQIADENVVYSITADVENYFAEEADVSVEQIQDVVEQILMDVDPPVAKAYILYRQRRAELRECHPDPKAVADYIHVSKYARYLPEKKRRETYEETVTRVKVMHKQQFLNLWPEIEKAFVRVYNKEILPSMRSMQFAGDAIRKHNARMYNCCFTLIDRIEAFSQTMYLLLCGCGVGFSVQKQHISKLPTIARQTKLVMHWSIEDTIEGWADAIYTLVKASVLGYHAEFDYSNIRPEGSTLNISGGKAPGHLPLKKCLENCRRILLQAQGRHLKPIECHDIICFISSAVLAGGIRRSSLISLFSQDDEEMLHCKDNFQFGGEHWQRALCNNSVVLSRADTSHREFRKLMELNRTNYGDPGYVFLSDKDRGINPCGEIGLWPKLGEETGVAFCNLVDINCSTLRTAEDFFNRCEAASTIATLQAGYISFPYLGNVSEKIAKRDSLIGVGLTGIMDCPIVLSGTILQTGVGVIRRINQKIAKQIGLNPAQSLTCIKPSGTGSLELGGISCGIHPHHNKRYFRRITANPLENPARFLKSINPEMVEVKSDEDWCITFPMEAVNYREETALEMLERVNFFYEHWTTGDHSISCTFTVSDDEWDELLQKAFEARINAATFLPKASDKEIPYCPRESVTTDRDVADWMALIRDYKPVDYSKMVEETDMTVKPAACDADSCEIGSGGYGDMGDGQYIGPDWVEHHWRKPK